MPGSIIDGGAFGGDTALATAWYTKVGTLTWDGNQAVNDGEAIYVLASQNATTAAGAARQFTSGFKASIDGFDIRGGDQQGFPGNINDLTGGPTGLPPGDRHPGRRDLRQRLRPLPADHQQRRAEQRRRLRDHPHRHA